MTPPLTWGHARSAPSASTLPHLLQQLLVGYILFLPVQLEVTGFLRVAPSDFFLCLYVLFGLRHIGLVKSSWSTGHAGLMAIFAIGLAVGIADAGGVTSYALLNKGLGLLMLFVAYAILTSAVATFSALEFVLRAYLFTVVVNVLVALVALGLWTRFAIDIPYWNFQHSRLSGLLVDPNAFGGLIAVAASIHFTTFFGKAPIFGGRLGAACALILALGLILTFSRSSWIGFSMGMVAVLISSPRIAARLVLAASVFLVPVAILFLRSDMTEVIRMAQRPEQIQARLDQLNLAYPLLADNPIFGIGLGTFHARYNVIVHNTSLWVATEFGLVGLSVFLLFFLGFIAKGAAALRTAPPDRRPLILGLMCAHLSMFGVSMGIEALYQRHWWMVMAMLSAAYTLSRTGTRRHVEGSAP